MQPIDIYIHEAYDHGKTIAAIGGARLADTTDVAGIVGRALDDHYPLDSMPSQRTAWNEFIEWSIASKVLTARINDSYMAAINGEPMPEYDYEALSRQLLDDAKRTGLMAE